MKNSQKILITGANGFIGSTLVNALVDSRCHEIVAATRKLDKNCPAKILNVAIGDIDDNTDWHAALGDVNTVIHTAARVHVMDEVNIDPLSEFREINVKATINLANQAVKAGVKRFIFISSIKVLGEYSPINKPYTNVDKGCPVDPYGISKYEAEQSLKDIAFKTGLEVVIIRPPLVYGPGVKANFYNMMKWLEKGVPLPLGSIRNKRSLVAIDNLVDLIVTCIKHPNAANETFLVSDGRDLSTTELLLLLGNALGKKPILIAVPMQLIIFAAKMMGQTAFSNRLCSSLQVDIHHTQERLNWQPPFSIEKSMLKTATAYKAVFK